MNMQKLLISVALLVLVGLASWWWWRGPSGHERIGGEAARQLVTQGARLVDVRSRAEFRAGHIEGAINVPVDELGPRMTELEPKGAPIVLYCRSGRRSAAAFERLQAAGFAAVYDLGSMRSW